MNIVQAILRTAFYVAVGCVISIVGAAFFFMNWHPDRDDYPLRGIDVSHHLGEIDWGPVAGDDVAFVYMKASEGGDFRDPAFTRNWAGAGAAGLARGAYHFFSLCQPGEKQAENFLAALPADGAMLAPVVDLEFDGNCARRPQVAELQSELSTFTNLVEQARGKQVIFYVPDDFYRAYLKGAGLNRRLWLRSIWHAPDYASDWVLWQYHDKGRVAGIKADVDLNVLQKGKALSDLGM